MDTWLLVIIALVFFASLTAIAFFLFKFSNSNKNPWGSNLKYTDKNNINTSSSSYSPSEKEFQRAKEILRKRLKKAKKPLTLEEKFFRAGIVTPAQIRNYNYLKNFGPIVLMVVLGFLGAQVSSLFAIIGLVFGGLIGLQLPVSILERKTLARGEEILYYLPIVIEQISIGVSSSLEIGPCLQKVVTMADERDSHNVVTELLRLVITLSKTGMSLEDALILIGSKSGHLELNQTFNALSQVVRHGGEISKQLQEMADTVSGLRENKIEAKIKRLELEATGPVALVFVGFLLILLTCIGLQMMKAFG